METQTSEFRAEPILDGDSLPSQNSSGESTPAMDPLADFPMADEAPLPRDSEPPPEYQRISDDLQGQGMASLPPEVASLRRKLSDVPSAPGCFKLPGSDPISDGRRIGEIHSYPKLHGDFRRNSDTNGNVLSTSPGELRPSDLKIPIGEGLPPLVPATSMDDIPEERRGSKDSKPERRKLSIFGSILRRVSIHRKESMPVDRKATFYFNQGDSDVETSDSESAHLNGKMAEEGKQPENGHIHGSAPQSEKARWNQILDSLFVILSGLYGILIVVLGSVIPLTETFVKSTAYPFEVFYMYLYGGSVVFLIYVYAYLLRRNRIKSEFITRTLSRSMSWTRSWARTWTNSKDEKAKRRRRISMDESNHHTGTFYLRLGAVGFGIGSMILSGLHFGQFFQLYDQGSPCTDIRQAIKPLLHLVFTFIQLYFIFMNSKMCIHRMKKLARFGLMHMCATNICVWFRCIVVETLHAIHHHHKKHAEDHASDHHDSSHDSAHAYDHHVTVNVTDYHGNDTYYAGRHLHAAAAAAVVAVGGDNSSDLCYWRDMMGKAVDAAAPYLYPCTIEYSLMSAGILYVMWHNVGNKPKRVHNDKTPASGEEDGGSLRNQRMSVDCTGSSRGLFLGIFLMVGAIITVVAFYVLISQEEMSMSAITLTHMSETTIYLVTGLAVVLAANRMKDLKFHADHKGDLEDTLILISYTGLICFAVFSLTAAVLHPITPSSGLTIVSNLTMVIQATIQTLFMLAGDRVSAKTHTQERRKPGREFVTFLLLCNFAMWIINTFETQIPEHNPIQVAFYGNDAWAIFTHISVPLGIYYRFHSTVCLSNIWKNAWKMRKHGH